MAFIHKILLTCKDATMLTCKKQENAISFKENIQLKIHLLVCKFCAMFYKQSNLLHQHLTKMQNENNESNTLQLDETKKAALQFQIDAELEK